MACQQSSWLLLKYRVISTNDIVMLRMRKHLSSTNLIEEQSLVMGDVLVKTNLGTKRISKNGSLWPFKTPFHPVPLYGGVLGWRYQELIMSRSLKGHATSKQAHNVINNTNLSTSKFIP